VSSRGVLQCVCARTFPDEIRKLAGITADKEFLNQLTFLAYNHHKLIEKVDTVVCLSC
jgi:hypothetical protein